MRRVLGFTILSLFICGNWSHGADVPGGLLRTAEHLPPQTYHLLVSPAYVISPPGRGSTTDSAGAYMSSELRYQPFDDFGVGFGFGAGEVGFNFGVNGTWYILPHIDMDPKFSITGGLYLNRVDLANFFAVKLTPTMSQTFYMGWGEFTPYFGLGLTPSFRLGEAANLFSFRATLGSQFTFRAMEGFRLLIEAGAGILESNHEIALGISYPFQVM